MKILVLGAKGQVGYELARCFGSGHQLVALDRRQVDFSIPGRVSTVIHEHRPNLVINAVAYTGVDKAETEPSLVMMINAIAVQELAQACQMHDAWLIHYSTDYVFDGTADKPYMETDPTSPLGIYGKTKLEGERLIQQETDKFIILRTSWVYSWRGANFVKTMLRLAEDRDELSVVNDQFGCPSYAPDIAVATARITAMLDQPDLSGIYHLCGSEPASWYEFARAVFATAGKQVTVNPIPGSDYPTPAQRPAYSILANDKLNRIFGISLPGYTDSLIDCIRRITLEG